MNTECEIPAHYTRGNLLARLNAALGGSMVKALRVDRRDVGGGLA